MDIRSVRHRLWQLFVVGLSLGLAACSNQTPQAAAPSAKVTTQIQMLSGTGSDDAVQWDFYCTKGRNCGKWSKIAVPSNWELQGFGGYDYGHVVDKHDEQGIYRRDFSIPSDWQSKTIKIVFDGVMTDATVFVNGQQVGAKHQGGFYRFSYDITPFLKAGQSNELKVVVDKISANKHIEAAERQADYWVFGGIFRQVFLQALPKSYIDWVSLDAKANGQFALDAYVGGDALPANSYVEGQILDMAGNPVGKPFSSGSVSEHKAHLTAQIDAPALWTAETPNLYQVRLQLKAGANTVHSLDKTFGFRTFEVRPHDGLYLNGTKITLKGVNRHSFRPETGRTLTKQISIDDIKLIKSMNMNAVRMSHYPPDVHFLEAADRMGIYVIDELTTWQKPVLDTPTAQRLVGELVRRDQIHPSILMWANGNEGGWNNEVNDDYAKYDLQQRPVIHPWELFRHIDTDHYPTYAELLAKTEQNEILMPTEFLHGLYDGGHGAGLRDFWNYISNAPFGAGGFLWVLADEGVVRTDENNRIDTDGNHAPDGIVGPHHELEGSYFTIKDIWAPIKVVNIANGKTLSPQFNGELTIKNLYDFIDLSGATLEWRLYQPVTPFAGKAKLVASHKMALPAIKPKQQGKVQLALPDNWQQQGRLEVEFYNAKHEPIWTDTWPIQTATAAAQQAEQDFTKQAQSGSKPQITLHTSKQLQVSVADTIINFDATTGLLQSYQKQGQAALTHGPVLLRSDDSAFDSRRGVWPLHDGTRVDDKATAKGTTELKTTTQNGDIVITVVNPPAGISKLIWTVHAAGYLSMDLDYQLDGKYVLHGVSFDYPKAAIQHKRWLGDGPYRVWANRLEGVKYGTWENDYNDGIAGEKWQFPEFKGYFSDIHWLTLTGNNSKISFSTPTNNLFVRVMQPDDGAQPANTLSLHYPGEISFLHRISPIGTKFHPANEMGPQGEAMREWGIRNIKLDIF
ncbi:glycoside hydrolase family 2 [Shewanella mangrovi]|uniref:glycoside hydrolase family 2 n=1 Tax=Shewanella mangrovi TaxID=1515746 RepID=UPI00068F42E8|nr:glycoside hydrolase family 2 [Shewanella mangrovi]